jgi:hypothetical protein
MNNFVLAGAAFVALATSFCVTAQTPAPKQASAPPAAGAPAPAPTGVPPAAGASAPKQSGAPAAALAPKASTSVISAAPPPEPEKPVKRVSHRVPSKADARGCLEFPTNLQIIKCAEKYRYASAS